jgi:hypothetical protein
LTRQGMGHVHGLTRGCQLIFLVLAAY